MTVMTETVARPYEQPATVRSQVTVPLRFPDGFAATAEVHDVPWPGRRQGAPAARARASGSRRSWTRGPKVPHRWSGCTANASPATCSAASAATAVPSCARQWRRLPPSGVSCCTSARRGAASACTPSSTRTPCRTRAWTPTKPTWRWAAARTSGTTRAAAQMLGALGAGRIRLLTNNPDKVGQLAALGVDVTEQVPTGVHLSDSQPPLPGSEAEPHRAHHRASGRRPSRGKIPPRSGGRRSHP